MLYFLLVDGIPILPDTVPAAPMDCFKQEVKKLEAIMEYETLLLEDSLDLWRFLCHYEIPLTRPVFKADIEKSGGIQSKLEDLYKGIISMLSSLFILRNISKETNWQTD